MSDRPVSNVKSHPRMPAVLILVIAAALGLLYLKNSPGVGPSATEAQTLEELELAIAAGDAPVSLWGAYAAQLAAAGRHAHAAAAYAVVLDEEPYHRDARIGRAMALAQAGDAEPFYFYMRDLVYAEAKLAVDLFERPAIAAYLAEERFIALHREARNQAAD